MNATTMLSQKDLRKVCEMSARYHSHRLRFLTGVHRSMMFFVALVGTAVFAKIFEDYYRWFGAATSIIVLVELVFDIQGPRSTHQDLYRRFASFLGEITSTPDADDETIRRWNRQIHDLHADEPPVYRALNAHVRNELAIRLGNDDEFYPLRWHHRLLKNFFAFPGYTPRKRP